MTQTDQQLREDLQFVRRAIAKRDLDERTPSGILILWATYILIGYPMLDFAPAAASAFLLIGGIVGGIASVFMGRRQALRAGHVYRAEGVKHALHWGSIFIAILALVALVFTRRDQFHGDGQVIGQIIALIVGLVYFLGGVHFDRNFIWIGLMLIMGAVLVGFVPRVGWTVLGVLISAGILLPVVLRRVSSAQSPSEQSPELPEKQN